MSIFTTERIEARKFTEADFPHYADLTQNEEVMRYFPQPLTEAEARTSFDALLANYQADFGIYALFFKKKR
ncbi:acetyltransferase [Listeria floridensis FSL S10-1187]|uniref:Acetyltransferase n=1 Tax=Listeria floridensis FSL S10-1187 TaxID=1265817 RepID=A0ABN0RHF7_9LIST|nr:GNAT family N-acetyltransferase [Listeria floridensis]EUJ33334.1 acetyltransferase [Listeria floridensis FSL S10-1187]